MRGRKEMRLRSSEVIEGEEGVRDSGGGGEW